jgi:RNA polymerase-binding transcription factor DksA
VLISESRVPEYFMAAKRKQKAPTRPKAATADIVGNRPVTGRVPAKWKPYYDRLVRLRDYLLHRQGDLVKDARDEQTAFSQHMADAGTDSFDRDLTLSRASSEQDAVYDIDLALNRIRDGTYGICELTGKPIASKRLEAIPWARFSVEAEKLLESEGAVRTAKLGSREPITRGDPETGDTASAGTADSE